MKYCVKCGNQLLDEAVLCTKCGCTVNSEFKVTQDRGDRIEKTKRNGQVHKSVKNGQLKKRASYGRIKVLP